jgi:nicotinate-nucleotide pyrophosphorylase (carboxylating)
MHSDFIDALIELAVSEDIGEEDHTSRACIPVNATGRAKLLVKEKGILSGINVAIEVFRKIDPEIKTNIYMQDGCEILPGDIAFEVMGRVVSILKSERLVLNFLQRMSGIATRTNLYVSKLEGLKTILLDTRKTTPGFRIFEKMAVETGGGRNHRRGLYDMILIKDNHIDFAGGIKNAIENVNHYLRSIDKNLKVEIEARSLDDIREILQTGHVDRIMLDNFSPDKTLEAVRLIDGKYETESSGNITLRNIRKYAECGVDYISVGALTHQIDSLDMSLKAVDF